MHDIRVDIIVSNAFNGMGDSSGSDEFGLSFAWFDLYDWIDIQSFRSDMPDNILKETDSYSDYGFAVAQWLATWEDMLGCRYALATIDSNGNRSAHGYDNKGDLMKAYRELESEYLTWLEI